MTVSALALAPLAAPAAAQQMNMPGMTMPIPAKPATKKKAKKAAVKKLAAKKLANSKRSAKKPAHNAQPPPMPMDRGRMTMPMPDTSSGEATPPGTGAMPTMDHDQAGAMPMQHGAMAGHDMAMTGALGAHPMERESSGTAWQPDCLGPSRPDDHARRLDADGARCVKSRRRPSVRPARRRQGFCQRHVDGHGPASARERHGPVQGDGQPRPAHGRATVIPCSSPAARPRMAPTA